MKKLRGNEKVIVIPTDKTSSFRLKKLTNYIEWMSEYLNKEAKEIHTDQLKELPYAAKSCAENLKDMLFND